MLVVGLIYVVLLCFIPPLTYPLSSCQTKERRYYRESILDSESGSSKVEISGFEENTLSIIKRLIYSVDYLNNS